VQVNSFSRVWLLGWFVECLCKWHERVNAFVHRDQLYGFISIWFFMYLFKFLNLFRENDFLQLGQLLCFSPVWTLKCSCKILNWANDFVQKKQLNGFSPMWTLKYIRKSAASTNYFEHGEQLLGFSLVYIPAISSQVSWSSEGLSTLRTHGAYERFLASMNSYMYLQVPWMGKRHCTHQATVGFLFNMSSYMFLQVIWLRKRLCTLGATVE
jgi:hypothetical protein